MASFEERSISSKVDSSDAETNENSSDKVRFSRLNVNLVKTNVNILSELTMADHLSTMENVMVQNHVDLQSTNTDTHSDTLSGQAMDCNSNTNDGHLEAENIVSSTQETAIDSFTIKLNANNSDSNVNKCDELNLKSQLPKAMANEKHINTEQSHVASALPNQNRKTAMDEPKRHLHISASLKTKSKSTERGL